MNANKKMQVEIWSDVMCPFCYIGKRRFEKALEQYPDKDHIEIVWKSYQLSPDMKTDPSKNIHQYLAEHKGMSLQEAKNLNEQVSRMAAGEGLVYDLDKAVVANSFKAHRFAHFAKQAGRQDEAEEGLFRAYFTEGKNIDDTAVLLKMGEEIGLDSLALKTALENGDFADDVRGDIYEAQQLGVRGVPFFVFDRKYAVSGAQESTAFSQSLDRSFTEWRKENPENSLEVLEGPSCKTDGTCD
jgi:predicted DsbA family dithiol-disulfide isomerase